jgi:C1A family cysteine protease
MSRTTRRFGWKPSHPSLRAPLLTFAEADDPTLPPIEDLGPFETQHGDQGSIGQCTGGASVWGILEFMRQKQGEPYVRLSAAFAYTLARMAEGTLDHDAGASIADVMNAVMKYGACPESVFPSDRLYTSPPPQEAFDAAIPFKGLVRYSVAQTRNQVRGALSSGLPIIIGFDVYENFMGIGRDGIMPMPSGSMIGGHAVDVMGHGRIIQGAPNNPYCRCRNDWTNADGSPWGDFGDFWMPEEHLLGTHCSELTVLQLVS